MEASKKAPIAYQTLLKNVLVDELWLKIFPLTLGKGKKLFDNGTIPAAFTLIESTVTPSGVVIANEEKHVTAFCGIPPSEIFKVCGGKIVSIPFGYFQTDIARFPIWRKALYGNENWWNYKAKKV